VSSLQIAETATVRIIYPKFIITIAQLKNIFYNIQKIMMNLT